MIGPAWAVPPVRVDPLPMGVVVWAAPLRVDGAVPEMA